MNEQQDFLDFSQPQQQVLLLLVVFGLITLVIHNLQRSASGRAMLAVRSSRGGGAHRRASRRRGRGRAVRALGRIAGFGGVALRRSSTSRSPTSVPPLIGLIWIAIAVTFGDPPPGRRAPRRARVRLLGADLRVDRHRLPRRRPSRTSSRRSTSRRSCSASGRSTSRRTPTACSRWSATSGSRRSARRSAQAASPQAETDAARRRGRCTERRAVPDASGVARVGRHGAPTSDADVPVLAASRTSSPGTATSRCCTASTSPSTARADRRAARRERCREVDAVRGHRRSRSTPTSGQVLLDGDDVTRRSRVPARSVPACCSSPRRAGIFPGLTRRGEPPGAAAARTSARARRTSGSRSSASGGSRSRARSRAASSRC